MTKNIDFPVIWDEPTEANRSWFLDAVHFPDQVSPLDFHLLIKPMQEGINRASQIYEMGLKDQYRHINTYIYDGPKFEVASSEETTARIERSQQTLEQTIATLDQQWQQAWLPEIKQHMDYWDTFDLHEATMPELVAHLSETYQRLQRVWEIHFLLFWPMVLALSQFEEMYQDLFTESNQFDAYALLGGFGNKTTEGNQILWQLSRKAQASTLLNDVLMKTSAENVITTLADSTEGREFLTELKDYLHEYGKQSDKLLLDNPSWLENPLPVIKNLQNYITQPNQETVGDVEKAVIQREKKIVEAYAALEDYPQIIRDKFTYFLNAAQVSYVLSEDHHFWIDCKVSYYSRNICLAFGERLKKKGVIEKRDDVFYLSVEEIKTAALKIIDSNDSSLRQAILDRKKIEEKFADCTPPDLLGVPFSAEMPDDPLFSAIDKFFGVMMPTEDEQGNEIKGYAGSPGIIQGTARIVDTLDDVEKLQSGDILVAKATSPSWTPLFATVAAIVTNSGGSLSHSAIVAREYNIPAVVGTGVGTSVIKDGQRIEVDGNNGIVRLF